MGKYRQHATTNSIAVTDEIFNFLKKTRGMLQQTSQELITMDDTLRYFFKIKENKWGTTRFEREV